MDIKAFVLASMGKIPFDYKIETTYNSDSMLFNHLVSCELDSYTWKMVMITHDRNILEEDLIKKLIQIVKKIENARTNTVV